MSDSDSESGGKESERDVNPVVRLLQAITPRPIRENFTLKFALVLIVMAVAIGGLGLYGTSQIQAETADRVEEDFRDATLQSADAVNEWILSNEVSTRLLSTDEVWGGNTPQPVQTMESELSVEQSAMGEDIHALHVVEVSDGESTVVASTSLRSGTSLDNSDRPFLADTSPLDGLEADDVYVSGLYEEMGTPVVAFVSPTEARENGYLVTEVSIGSIGNSLRGDGVRKTQVVNSEGTVVISDDVTEVPSMYAESESAREPLREAENLRDDADRSVGVITDMSGNPDVIDETYTVGYAPVESADWTVLVHSPRSEEFGFADTLSSYGLLVTLGAVLVIGIIGTIMGYSTATSIDRLTNKTEEMREGNLDVPIHTTRVDNIGRLYDSFDEMRDDLKTQIREAENARKEAEVARAEAEEMSEYLRERAGEYSEIMQDVGAGDLTQRMEPDGEEASMDRIAEEFNEMITELEQTIGQLKDYVDEVEQAGAEVEGSAETVRDASEQIAESVQKISDDAYDQKESLEGIAATTDDVADELAAAASEYDDPAIDDAVAQIDEIAGNLDEIATLSEEMMAETEGVAGASEEQAAELAEVSERANDLQRYAQPLRDILQQFETDQEHEFVFSIGPTGSEDQPGPGPGQEE